jgi:hypothetical protein
LAWAVIPEANEEDQIRVCCSVSNDDRTLVETSVLAYIISHCDAIRIVNAHVDTFSLRCNVLINYEPTTTKIQTTVDLEGVIRSNATPSRRVKSSIRAGAS